MRGCSDAVALANRFRNFQINPLGVLFSAFDRTDWNSRTFKRTTTANDHKQVLGARKSYVDSAIIFHELTADFTRADHRDDDHRAFPSLKLIDRIDLNIQMLPVVSTF